MTRPHQSFLRDSTQDQLDHYIQKFNEVAKGLVSLAKNPEYIDATYSLISNKLETNWQFS